MIAPTTPLTSEGFNEDELLSFEDDPSQQVGSDIVQDNVLLVYGVGFVLLAAGMVLPNLLSGIPLPAV